MLFDSHMHFDDTGGEFAPERIMKRSLDAGVQKMIAVGGCPASNRLAVDLSHEYPGRVWAAVGHDRDQAERQAPVDELDTQLSDPATAALGEIGLDFYYNPGNKPAQKKLFEQMLLKAGERRLPVIVHSREADEATIAILRKHVVEWRGEETRIGVLHCFTGGRDFARELVDMGFHISFSGIITFRNAHELRSVACLVPEDRLLIETDSPYLAPEPHRGGRNEPAHLPLVARTLAEVRDCSVKRISEITTRNAERLFNA